MKIIWRPIASDVGSWYIWFILFLIKRTAGWKICSKVCFVSILRTETRDHVRKRGHGSVLRQTRCSLCVQCKHGSIDFEVSMVICDRAVHFVKTCVQYLKLIDLFSDLMNLVVALACVRVSRFLCVTAARCKWKLSGREWKSHFQLV